MYLSFVLCVDFIHVGSRFSVEYGLYILSDPVHDEGASGVATDEQVPDPDRGHDDHHDLNAILGLIHSTTGAMHRDLNLLSTIHMPHS